MGIRPSSKAYQYLLFALTQLQCGTPFQNSIWELTAIHFGQKRENVLACVRREIAHAFRMAPRDMQADGYNVNALSPKELLEHEPFLAKDLIGGLFSDIDLGLNPYKLCFAFVDTVLGKGLDLYTYTNVTGVRLDGEKRVQGVDTDKGFIPCGKVVNACGVWSPRNYLDVCLDIPWNTTTRERVSVDAARKVLEHDHYGLEKVKERILETIAVPALSAWWRAWL